MDYFDTIRSIEKAYPEISHDEIRSAMDSEINTEMERSSGRNQYQRAVQVASDRIIDWLNTGTEYHVNLSDLDDLARFVSSHRMACVWAVIKAKARDRVVTP